MTRRPARLAAGGLHQLPFAANGPIASRPLQTGHYMEELMPRKDSASTKGPNVSRRKFMAGVAVTGAATAVSAEDGARAAAPSAESAAARRPSALRLDTVMAAAETGTP